MSIKYYLDLKYLGVKEFVKFANLIMDPTCKLSCPCKQCNNFETLKVVANHFGGIVYRYIKWIYHCQSFEESHDDENDSISYK